MFAPTVGMRKRLIVIVLLAVGMMLTAGAKTPAKAMCGQGGFGDSVPIPCGCDEVGPGWLCGTGNCNISGNSEYIIYTCGGCVPPD